jgi:hypothetical protein
MYSAEFFELPSSECHGKEKAHARKATGFFIHRIGAAKISEAWIAFAANRYSEQSQKWAAGMGVLRFDKTGYHDFD